jgi:hypothetical protein
MEMAISILRAGYILDCRTEEVSDYILGHNWGYIKDNTMKSRIKYVIKMIESAHSRIANHVLTNEMRLVHYEEYDVLYESAADCVEDSSDGKYDRMILVTRAEEILECLEVDKSSVTIKYAYIRTDDQMIDLM